ncbi:sensor histidine kinase [Actinomadura graeca]|uniref:Sensor histidine kinase n=1 Tax=Actinomadura graeca TaxID=2750812 RepID=A0ABX8RAY2_9ACTN|nr:sensor histidine kinase [Actinomadura graeca]
MWRAVAVYRVASLAYAALVIAVNSDGYARPWGGWAVLAVMTAWTVYAVPAFRGGHRKGRPLLAADLAVAFGCILATAWVETASNIGHGRPTLPISWVAAAVLSWAVAGGRRAGIAAALTLGVANLLVHVVAGTTAGMGRGTFNGVVLLLLTGLVVGHVVRLALEAEARLARAVEMESATRERERLARRIHDSVLQVLAMVQRRGGELGGEAAELGRLAGEQEAALRAMIGTAAPITAAAGTADGNAAGGPGRTVDLRPLLAGHGSTSVTVSAPATQVRMPEHAAREVEAAVAAALDNVRRHCGDGARAWVLLEDDGAGAVTVSVRDDGPGMPADRLAAAAADGRLGVAQSIRGRIRDLGGSVSIVSAPGEGTEIEMTVPGPAAASAGGEARRGAVG